MKALYGTLLLAAFLALNACDSNGPTGPQGPPGNANVHTVTIEFLADDMIIDGASGVASLAFDVPTITPSVVDDGAVLAFFAAEGTWTALPYTYAYESTRLEAVDHTIEFGYGFEHDDAGGFVEFFYEPSIPEVDATKPGNQRVKVVVIDGFPVGKSGLDLHDHDAVMEYFGLNR